MPMHVDMLLCLILVGTLLTDEWNAVCLSFLFAGTVFPPTGENSVCADPNRSA